MSSDLVRVVLPLSMWALIPKFRMDLRRSMSVGEGGAKRGALAAGAAATAANARRHGNAAVTILYKTGQV
jgi:hypothetical protein